MSVRLSVNINDETENAIRELQIRKDISATEVIRKAVSFYYFLENEIYLNNKEMQLLDEDGRTTTYLLVS